MKRNEGDPRRDREGDRLAEPQHSRVRQRACYQEARLEGRIYEKRGRGEDIPDRKLTWHTRPFRSRLENGAALVVLVQFRPRCAVRAKPLRVADNCPHFSPPQLFLYKRNREPPFPKSCYRLFMAIGFLDRLKMAWRFLIDARFAEEVDEGLKQFALARTKASDPPERVHASGLMLLATFQREGRLVDFLQQETAGFSDEEIGVAARVVHDGCHKALQQFFEIAPAVRGDEGAPMSVPAGFDPERIRLTGNVSGQPPFKGILKHHGWLATQVRMPSISQTLDPCVIAPAEVELS